MYIYIYVLKIDLDCLEMWQAEAMRRLDLLTLTYRMVYIKMNIWALVWSQYKKASWLVMRKRENKWLGSFAIFFRTNIIILHLFPKLGVTFKPI